VGERIEPSLVSWCGQGAGCFIAVGNDDLADHTEKRYDSFGFRPGSQAGAIGIGDGADAISAADTSDVHAIVGRQAAGFRLHGTDPKRWVWKLDGRQGYRNILQVEVATMVIQRPAAHGLKNDVSRLTIAALRFAGLHAKETELDWCRAAAHTRLDPGPLI
jgi:hypothetical protein